MGMFLRRGPAPHRTRMSDLEIGQFIMLNLNNTSWYWRVVHQGRPSSLYDESCNGTWLLMKDIYNNTTWAHSAINIYENSSVYSYLNADFLDLFDINIRTAIKQVKIPYRKNGGSSGTDQSGENGLPAKAFLLSGYEVGFTKSDDTKFPTDGAKLDYFELGSSKSARIKRIATLNSKTSDWWLRSPSSGNDASVWHIDEDGSSSNVSATRSKGMRPAIILPSDMLVTDDMLLPANIKTMTLINDRTLARRQSNAILWNNKKGDQHVYHNK